MSGAAIELDSDTTVWDYQVATDRNVEMNLLTAGIAIIDDGDWTIKLIGENSITSQMVLTMSDFAISDISGYTSLPTLVGVYSTAKLSFSGAGSLNVNLSQSIGDDEALSKLYKLFYAAVSGIYAEGIELDGCIVSVETDVPTYNSGDIGSFSTGNYFDAVDSGAGILVEDGADISSEVTAYTCSAYGYDDDFIIRDSSVSATANTQSLDGSTGTVSGIVGNGALTIENSELNINSMYRGTYTESIEISGDNSKVMLECGGGGIFADENASIFGGSVEIISSGFAVNGVDGFTMTDGALDIESDDTGVISYAVSITGGEIQISSEQPVSVHTRTDTTSQITLATGEYNGSIKVVNNIGGGVSANISGDTVVRGEIEVGKGGSLNVSGGYFSEPISEEYISDEFEYQLYSEGLYSYHESIESAMEIAEGDYTLTDIATGQEVVQDAPTVPDPNPITITQSANGTISTNFSNASVGATITVTATPNSGYELAYITVNGERIAGNTFTMPDKAVTVSAVFIPATGGFADVVPGAWYVDAVNYVVANGLMEGTSATTFEPEAQMTRAMFWTILARIDGETITGATWADDARAWAMANGVSDGTNPHAPLPREQLVTMLWRYLGEPATTGTLSAYTDAASVSAWAKTAMAWAIEKGIITGVTTTTLAPQSVATRAQCATILMRNAF